MASAPEITTLAAPKLFKYVASIRGDFVSSENAWYGAYGDVYGYLDAMGSTTLGGFYTYLDAPVSDVWTNMEGSSNDIGALGIAQSLGAASHEFTVRLGSFDDAFLAESVNRILDRMTNAMLTGISAGTVTLKKAALTEEVETAEVEYKVSMNELYEKFSSVDTEMEVIVSVVDPKSGDVLASVSENATASMAEAVEGSVEIKNVVNGDSSTVQLSVKILGAEVVLATATLVRVQDTIEDEDYQHIDLMGDWYFKYYGTTGEVDGTKLDASEFETWDIVQPGLGYWDIGYGNITRAHAEANWPYGGWGMPLPDEYVNYCLYYDGWYGRTFEVTDLSKYDESLILSVGNMDDRGEVFINGVRVGGTGLNEDGASTGETTWAVFSVYDIDSSVLKEGTNTITVRVHNDGMGGGGWAAGPIGIYNETAYNDSGAGESRFMENTFESSYAASAQGLTGTVENEYLVYLPQDYYETEHYYPTVYLMHQYNSDHTSYITDDIDKLMDEAIKQALIDGMIVVVPNSTESSWWSGDWMKMVTEELVPLIDSEYRTIEDARYRFTAGCSMGGQGAYGVALTNPDLFSGAISFFGAFSMGGEASPNYIAANETAEYLDYYTMYFICGNQYVYGFGEPAIELNQILESKGVDHRFFIENGEHDSVFYVPYFIDAMIYMRDNMYHSDDIVGTLMSGDVAVDGTKLTVDFKALEGIEAYYNLIPDSSYTVDGTPDLSLPLIIEVEQNGEIVFSTVERDHVINTGDETSTFTYDLTGLVDASKEYTVTYKVAVFDRVVELKNVKVADGKIVVETEKEHTKPSGSEESKPSTPEVSDKPAAGTADTVDTGDHAPIALYLGLAVVALAAMTAAIKMRRRA